MATSYPRDRFDDLPAALDRVGAHRAPPRRGRGWIAFAWAALVTGLLVAAGIAGLSLVGDSVELPFTDDAGGTAAPPPPEETEEPVAPVLDPALPVTVLNGTTTPGLANSAGDALVAQGWCGAVATETPVDGPCIDAQPVGSRLNAATQDVAQTVVYYGDPVNEPAALALVQALGVGGAMLSEDYPESPAVVVLGADYVPPVG